VQIEKRESKGFGMDDKICCLFAFSWKGSRILLVSPLILMTVSSFTNNMVQGKLFKLGCIQNLEYCASCQDFKDECIPLRLVSRHSAFIRKQVLDRLPFDMAKLKDAPCD
jgi:hypothetical protein